MELRQLQPAARHNGADSGCPTETEPLPKRPSCLSTPAFHNTLASRLGGNVTPGMRPPQLLSQCLEHATIMALCASALAFPLGP